MLKLIIHPKSKTMKTYLFIFSLMLLAVSCTSHRYSYSPQGQTKSPQKESAPEAIPIPPVKYPVTAMIPKATAFRMSGDYADNVAITLDADGVITYFPAPSDITADSKPLSLGDGWWLNNQGIGPNSVFTTYTFADYAALPEVPSIEQLKNAIIPGAVVTQFIELPCSINEANRNLNELKSFLKGK